MINFFCDLMKTSVESRSHEQNSQLSKRYEIFACPQSPPILGISTISQRGTCMVTNANRVLTDRVLPPRAIGMGCTPAICQEQARN